MRGPAPDFILDLITIFNQMNLGIRIQIFLSVNSNFMMVIKKTLLPHTINNKYVTISLVQFTYLI